MDQNPPKESRPPINLRIKFRSESVEQFIERYAVDVSRGGIFIRTREPLAVGTQLKLDFQFQNGTALMAGDGTVVWIREFDANRTSVPPGMGVRFDKLTPESQAVLEQLLVEKAKRERSGGVPGSGNQGAGGIAVRRPSSMFAVLDPQGRAAVLPGAAAGSPQPSSGPLAAVTAQVGSASQTMGAPTGSAASSGGEQTEKREIPAYRPLGTARNPFSSVGPLPTAHPSTTGEDKSKGDGDKVSEKVSDKDSDKTAAVQRVGVGSASASPAESSAPDSAAPFDDINDEPTQIAGRLPSFLLSDDDDTVAAAQVPILPSDSTTRSATVTTTTAAATPIAVDKRPSGENSAAGTRRPLPGMGKVSIVVPAPSATGGSASRRKSSGFAATAASGGAASTAGSAPAAAVGSPAGSPTGARPGGTATAAVPPPPIAAGVENRRAAALWIGVIVVVLGATGIFLFRFFTAQATDGGPSMGAPANSITAAAPTEEQPVAAAPAAVAPVPPPVVVGADGTGVANPTATDTGTPSGVAAAQEVNAPASPSPSPVPSPARATSDAVGGTPSGASGSDSAPGTSDSGTRSVGGAGSGSRKSKAKSSRPPRETTSVEANNPATSAASNSADPKAESRAADPKAADPKAVDPKAVDPKAVDPRAVDPKAVDPKAVDPKAVDPKAVAPKAVAPKTNQAATPPAGSSGGAVIAAPTSVAALGAGAPSPSPSPSAPANPPLAASTKSDEQATAPDPGEGPIHQIRVTSKPDGAEVVLDGQSVGKTPFTVGIADVNAPHSMLVRKDGFESFEQMFSATSAWSKPKTSKGKAALRVLKINAKLKPIVAAESTPVTEPIPAATDPASKVLPKADRPLAPTEERPAAGTSP